MTLSISRSKSGVSSGNKTFHFLMGRRKGMVSRLEWLLATLGYSLNFDLISLSFVRGTSLLVIRIMTGAAINVY